jgi:cytochrome P450
MFSGTEKEHMRRLHTKYGPVVRYAPRELSFCDGRAWRDIYVHEKGRRINIKDMRIDPLTQGRVPSLASSNDEDHARIRRIFAPAFSERGVKQQSNLFHNYADAMVGKLRKATEQGHEVDMVKMFNYTTFDIMAELTFGESLGLLDRADYSPWVQSLFDMLPLFPVIQFIQYHPWLAKAVELVKPAVVRKRERAFFE